MMGLKSNPWDLSSFSVLTLSPISYNVFGGTINLAQSIVTHFS